MATPLLTTKLFVPAPRPEVIPRPRLLARLDEGLRGRLTLISAPAGFGKTTLLSAWLAAAERPVAWVALDAGDGEPTRFLTYLVAAMQTIAPGVGHGVLGALRAPQPPPSEALLTALINDLAAIPAPCVLVLDDYHAVEAPAVDQALAFLVAHLPPQLHLIIATREDPQLPLARLRARGQLAELRAADLRFTQAEAAAFLNQGMGLALAPAAIAALETRTEGWIAGLQLAALSLQGRADVDGFITSFTGSHRFVLDYLLEEVLQQQPAAIQRFLLSTSVLERLCGPLCDAVLQDPAAAGQATLEQLEQANLFIVPLDSERRWYRYHHLFGEMLRQRLGERLAGAAEGVAALHIRASAWYEGQGLELEAFGHAVAAADLDRAARLAEGGGMPLLFRGAIAPVLGWLEALPRQALDARPGLWVMYASALAFATRLPEVEQKLLAAEAAFAGLDEDARVRDHLGHIAAIRATLAVSRHQPEVIEAQARRALEYLHPANLPIRTAATWALGYAYLLQGERAAAAQAYGEALAISQAIGHFIIHLLTTLGLAYLHEGANQLALAAESYRRALELAGDPPQPVVCEAHLGLARSAYQWDDLASAQRHAQLGARLAQQLASTDRAVAAELFLARLRRAQGDPAGAAAILGRAEQAVQRQGFLLLAPALAEEQVLTLLVRGDLPAAALLAQASGLPTALARVHLAQGRPAAAIAAIEPWLRHAEARGWPDEQLRALVLLALARQAHGDPGEAARALEAALALGAPDGLLRVFADEGEPMHALLTRRRAAGGPLTPYLDRLLAVFAAQGAQQALAVGAPPLVEPLSERELLVLRLVAQGLSNHEIGERLVLALSTVKGHNRNIFGKLQVQRRTEAVARARELGLL